MCWALCSMLAAKRWITQSLTPKGDFCAASLEAKEVQAEKTSWRR